MNEDHYVITQEFEIPASVDTVWAFLMNEEKMKRWLRAEEFEVSLWGGGKIEIPHKADGKNIRILGELSILYPKKEYGFTWYERDALGREWFNCTTVTFKLSEKEGRTEILFLHDGFKNLDPEIRDEAQQRYTDYWAKDGMLDRLRTSLDDHA